MELINYSAEPIHKLINWLPNGLEAEKVIFFPDACPGKSPLPTGTVVYTKQPDWRKFAVSDCGCGMLLAKSEIQRSDFDRLAWDEIYHVLKNNKGKLGDLGSGNHFLDALESYTDDFLYFSIHTGSRNESKLVEHVIEEPAKFDKRFLEVCDWAENNRKAIAEIVSGYFGKLQIIVDRNHNNFEYIDDGVVIRKGAVKIGPNELTVLPSNLNGDMVLVKATDNVDKTFVFCQS